MKTTMLVLMLVIATATARIHLEAEHTHVVPSYWSVDTNELSLDTPLHLTFAVKLRNVDALRQQFEERSDPTHKDYQQWYNAQEIAEEFGSNPVHLKLVSRFLKRANFKSIEVLPHGFVRGLTTVGVAEQLFQTKLARYTASHFRPLIRLAAGKGYSLPAPVGHVIDFVGGLKGQFPSPGYDLKIDSAGKIHPDTATDPPTIAQQYGTSQKTGTNSNSSMAFVELIGQHFAQSDVNTFFQQLVPGKTAPVIKVEGGFNNGQVGIESALDSEYLAAVGYGVPPQCWSVSPSANAPFLEWAANVNAAKEAPYIFSISYGESEVGNSASLLHRLDDEFKKMGLRGISIFIAAGDSGVAAQPGGCTDRTFDPDWPASSPSITAVGGTQLNGNSETLWVEGGGGFSSMFPQPTYQKAAVNHYITTNQHLPPSHFYNASNRGYPDISAFASFFPIIVNGGQEAVGGTSCATPTSAAVIALVQDTLFNNGAKKSLGFLNPLIYQVGNAGFTDIDGGSCNEGCEGVRGFCTSPGWDAASGYGSVYYPNLVKHFGNALGLN